MEQQGRIRRRVWFSGRVQGVGFRYATVRVAGRYQVTGWVRNLPDGRVELVAEAEPAEVERFVAAVTAAMDRYIDASDERTETACGELRDFTIRYD